MIGDPYRVQRSTERLRARFERNIRGLDYRQAEGDVLALLEAHDHYRDDASHLRRERELFWADAVRFERTVRRSRMLRTAEWWAVIVVWTVALIVLVRIFTH